ncbi:hypothetical protein LTR39_004353, partial [Cryomyces antarcticus]
CLRWRIRQLAVRVRGLVFARPCDHEHWSPARIRRIDHHSRLDYDCGATSSTCFYHFRVGDDACRSSQWYQQCDHVRSDRRSSHNLVGRWQCERQRHPNGSPGVCRLCQKGNPGSFHHLRRSAPRCPLRV